ncbi:RNA polymerase sigma factor [Fulvivirgaceae bacterium BMA10]|uniref:RNA polymerase sigma factor n=1 Tax=Splendidivirga corallicola TaxID=3051826 RepID=A0ABT8KJF3_9BACT|nr:RNA polymerase sigma factor [Fulvivirgaceae bacterium BMA10]
MLDPDLVIQLSISGDEQAFTTLVKEWYSRIYNFSLRYFNDHDMAMEVTQKTFISAHKNISKLENYKSFRSWLYRIASNYCHEQDRRSKRSKVFSLFSHKKNDELVDMVDIKTYHANQYETEKTFRKEEITTMLKKAMAQIPEDQRVILIMKEYEGFKFREIAEALQLSENTVKSRMYYGLRALKKVLDKWNVNQEIYYEL